MSGVEINALAQSIRIADGNHRMGAGELAEALMSEVERIARERVRIALLDAASRIVREAGLLTTPSGRHPAVQFLYDEAERMQATT